MHHLFLLVKINYSINNLTENVFSMFLSCTRKPNKIHYGHISLKKFENYETLRCGLINIEFFVHRLNKYTITFQVKQNVELVFCPFH